MEPEAESKRSTALLSAAALSVLAVGVALARGWEPGIRGEWVWRPNELPARLWLPLLLGVALAFLTWLLCRGGVWQRMTAVRRALSLAGVVAVVFALQVALLNAVGIPWIAPGAYIISPNTTTYFSVSIGVQSPVEWIGRYPEILPALPYHAATHPPGLVLLFWLARKLCAVCPISAPADTLDALVALGDTLGMRLTRADAAASIFSAVLIALLGALGLVPLYLLASLLTNKQTAICAACLAGGMPGLLLLGASPDLIVMTLTVGALFRGYAGYRGSRLSGLLAGIAVAVGLFLSYAFLMVIAWAGVWLAVGVMRAPGRAAAFRSALRAAAGPAASFLGVHVVLYLVFGYRPIATTFHALSAHRAVTTVEAARTYWKWVLMNPVECSLFTGLPLLVAACWSSPLLRDPNAGRLRRFLSAWLVLFLLVDLAGVVRGEVGRIWLFLLWPGAIAGASLVASRSDAGRAAALLVLMQVAQALVMKGYLTIYSIL